MYFKQKEIENIIFVIIIHCCLTYPDVDPFSLPSNIIYMRSCAALKSSEKSNGSKNKGSLFKRKSLSEMY